MKARFARLRLFALTTAVLTVSSLPAYAAHNPTHVVDQIWAVVAEAEQDMDDAVSAYGTTIAGLQSPAEVLAAETAAEDTVIEIWTDAKSDIEDLVQLYSGLGSTGGQAKQQILQKRSQSLAAISDLTAAWVPNGTTTTTTPATTTTTTPGSSPTTTGPRGNSTTTTPGSSPTTTKPHGNSNTSTTTTTTTTTVGGSGVVPPPPGNGDDNGRPPTDSGDGGSASLDTAQATVVAQTPAQMPPYDTVQLSGGDGPEENEVTEQMSAALETVLPPAAVELVLSPLLILEILIRTSLAGGKGIVVPLLSLAVCAVLIYLTDRFSRRVTDASEPTPINAG